MPTGKVTFNSFNKFSERTDQQKLRRIDGIKRRENEQMYREYVLSGREPLCANCNGFRTSARLPKKLIAYRGESGRVILLHKHCLEELREIQIFMKKVRRLNNAK